MWSKTKKEETNCCCMFRNLISQQRIWPCRKSGGGLSVMHTAEVRCTCVGFHFVQHTERKCSPCTHPSSLPCSLGNYSTLKMSGLRRRVGYQSFLCMSHPKCQHKGSFTLCDFSDFDCDSSYRNEWVLQASMEVFTPCECDIITNSYLAH